MSESDIKEMNERLHIIEKAALAGDRNAVINVVSSWRILRQKIEQLAKDRYSDGECDGATMYSFFDEIWENYKETVLRFEE